MTSVEELWGELAQSRELPYGRARTAIGERLTERADALGDQDLAWSARMVLLESYSYGGEPLKRFAPFAWLLARYDAAPGEVEESDRAELLWAFKWVTVGAVSHPGVSLAQIEQGLADMRDRYTAAGEGLAPYLGCRFQVDAHVHGYQEATDAYLAWTRAPRTWLSDCQACEPTTRTEYLAAVGRHADAVREAGPVLARGGCAEQPQSAISHALEPLLRLGEPERAAAEHLRGARLMRSHHGVTAMWARHILVLARSGRLMRGLDLLEDHLGEVDAPPTPEDGMWLAAAGARLLRGLADSGQGDLPVEAGQESVAQLGDRLAGTALDLAGRFDARNGTGAVGARVRDWLDAEPLPDLPLDRVTTRRAAPPRPAAATRTAPGDRPFVNPSVAAPSPGPAVTGAGTSGGPTAAEVADRFERSRVTQVRTDWEQALDDWRDLRSTDGAAPQLSPVRSAWLDAALVHRDLMAGRAEVDALVAAADRLAAAGDPAGGAFYRVAALREQVDQARPGAGPDVTAGVDELLAGAAVTCTPVELAGLAVPLGTVLRSAAERGLLGDEEAAARAGSLVTRGLEVLEGVDLGGLTPQQRGGLALLLLDSAGGLEPPARLTRLRDARELLPAGTRAADRGLLGFQLAGTLAEAGAMPEALDLLAEVVADSTAAGIPLLAARAWAMTGGIHRHLAAASGEDGADADGRDSGARLERAVEALWQADRLLTGTAGCEEVADNRRDLAFALIDAGRPLEAAEMAESAIRLLEDELAGHGLHAAPDAERLTGTAGAAGSEPAGSEPSGDAVPEPLSDLARLLGSLSFAAAIACRSLDERAAGAAHARRGASWHRRAGWDVARAEALGLLGQLTEDEAETVAAFGRAAQLYQAGDRWREAARFRRALAGAVLDVAGEQAAREAIAAAWAALDGLALPEGEERAYTWERLALTEQSAQVLLRAGQVQESLDLAAGLDDRYRELGDLGSVWDVALLRAQALELLSREEEAIELLGTAAAQARTVGAPDRARELGGRLAVLLDDLGRPEEAEAAWERFGGE